MNRSFAYILLTGVLFLFSTCLRAQEFASLEMEHIYQSLLGRCVFPKEDDTFRIDKSALTAYAKFDGEGKIKQLGINLFSDEEKKAVGRTLCDFHERFLLTVLLAKSDVEANKFLNQKKVKIGISGISFNQSSFTRSSLEQLLLKIAETKPRFLALRNDFDWMTTWEGTNFSLSLTFPADIQLMMGMDKKEMGLFFKQELEEHSTGIEKPDPLIFNQETAKEIRKGTFMLPGESYFIKSMNSNAYIIKDSIGGFSTLFDQRYPEESISNLFIAPGQWVKGLEIKISQQIYDSTYVYRKPLEELISFLREDYETFIGIEHCSQKRLDFTVIFRSKNYTFHHMIFVETTLDDVFKKGKPMNGTLYTYIPNHNIKDLYHNQWNEQ